MDKTEIKTENEGLNCVICLRNDSQLFGEHEIKNEILELYKDLLKNYCVLLNGMMTEICLECLASLNGMLEFKSKCITSVQILGAKVHVMPMVVLEDVSTIKVKEEMFVEELPVHEETKTTSKGQKTVKSKTKKQKTVKAQKNTDSKPDEIKKEDNDTGGYCYICCRVSNSRYKHNLKHHTRMFSDDIIACLLCCESSTSAKSFHEHLKDSHHEFEYPKKCGKCEFETKLRETYVQHVHKMHYPERDRIHICDFCPAVHIGIDSSRRHIYLHQGALKCKYCEYAFFDENERIEHIKNHEERFAEIRCICDFCGYRTRYKDALTKHIFSIHVKEPNFPCQECGKYFKTKQKVRKHVNRVHAKVRSICPHCGVTFSNTEALKSHIYRYHNVNAKITKKKKPLTREFACDQCDMKFFRKAVLQKHSFTHSKTRPYQCQVCSTGYYMNDYLRKHYLREHGVTYTAKDIRKMCGFKIRGDLSD